MLKILSDFLSDAIESRSKPTTEQENELLLQLAAATLVIEVSRSDGTIDAEELDHIAAFLRTEFALDDEQVEQLLDEARDEAESAISLQSFTRRICEQWDMVQRRRLIEYCWLIAMADQHIDAHERHTIRKIAGLLYLNDKEVILAKEAAKSRLAKA